MAPKKTRSTICRLGVFITRGTGVDFSIQLAYYALCHMSHAMQQCDCAVILYSMCFRVSESPSASGWIISFAAVVLLVLCIDLSSIEMVQQKPYMLPRSIEASTRAAFTNAGFSRRSEHRCLLSRQDAQVMKIVFTSTNIFDIIFIYICAYRMMAIFGSQIAIILPEKCVNFSRYVWDQIPR